MIGGEGSFVPPEAFESANDTAELESAEEKKERRYGCNVTIKNYWNRHAQKQSGAVMAGSGLSSSLISEKGASAAHDFGAGIEGQADGAKAYVTKVARTSETVENILDGYQQNNPDAPVRNIRIEDDLLPNYPENFLELYDQKFVANRDRIMTEMGLDPATFKELDADTQEQIAEKAEEPVVQEWMKGGELHQMLDPQLAANIFARVFNRHTNRIAQKLYDGSSVDLFHVTHKGVMEPFLSSGILVRMRDGQHVGQLGESLSTMEGWESETTTDDKGQLQTIITLRGERYIVDQAKLREMARGDKVQEAIALDQIKESSDSVIASGISTGRTEFIDEFKKRFFNDPDRLIYVLRGPDGEKTVANPPILPLMIFALNNPEKFKYITEQININAADISQEISYLLLYRKGFKLAENDEAIRAGVDISIEAERQYEFSSMAFVYDLLNEVGKVSVPIALETATQKLIPIYKQQRNSEALRAIKNVTRKLQQQSKKENRDRKHSGIL